MDFSEAIKVFFAFFLSSLAVVESCLLARGRLCLTFLAERQAVVTIHSYVTPRSVAIAWSSYAYIWSRHHHNVRNYMLLKKHNRAVC
jgi:hypothetical protein